MDYAEDLQLCQLIVRLLGSVPLNLPNLLQLVDKYPSLLALTLMSRVIPLPQIRFTDQPDYSHAQKAYLLLDDLSNLTFYVLICGWLTITLMSRVSLLCLHLVSILCTQIYLYLDPFQN